MAKVIGMMLQIGMEQMKEFMSVPGAVTVRPGDASGSPSWITRNNFRNVAVKRISDFQKRWGNGGSFDWFAAD